ncbi:MAG: hypothetical protein LR015_15465 [Verrucomicrobia bacterium]|nr:hypothetical protein [Verrucomicrobiota bacterium]
MLLLKKSVTAQSSASFVSQVLACDVFSLGSPLAEEANLVFADAPYADVPSAVPRLLDWLGAAWQRTAQSAGFAVIEVPGSYSIANHNWKIVSQLGKGRHQPTVFILKFLCEPEIQS